MRKSNVADRVSLAVKGIKWVSTSTFAFFSFINIHMCRIALYVTKCTAHRKVGYAVTFVTVQLLC